MKNILIHVCCAGCVTVAIERLSSEWNISLFYSNSNIYPREEHEKRLSDVKKIAKMNTLEVLEDVYDENDWLEHVKGLESEPERGKRCDKCIEFRLKRTVIAAKKNKFEVFTSTLTTSPHKNAEFINKTGKEIASTHGIQFLSLNLKKKDGFKRSVELSKKHELYRQDYCGCRFSKN